MIIYRIALAIPFLFFRIYAQEIKSTDLVGVWHKSKTIGGDAWLAAYQFFPDGKFVYHFSQYDDIGRIRSLTGTYRISSGFLYTRIDSREELVGGFVQRGAIGFQEEWTLDSSKVKKFKQVSSDGEDEMEIKLVKANPVYFILGGRKDWTYYRLSLDPNYYH